MRAATRLLVLVEEVDGVGPAEADMIESLEILAETPYERLPAAAIERMGVSPGQKNVLLRVVLRALDRSLTHAECNVLRDRIYAALHEGDRSEWARP